MQPYPKDRTGAVYDIPGVADASYESTGLATEAGDLSNFPMPSAGHPAAFSGVGPVLHDVSPVSGPDNEYGAPHGGAGQAPAPGTFMPGPSNIQPTGPTPEMGNNANPGITMAGPTDHYAE